MKPPPWRPTNREYHGSPGVSSSMLATYCQSPRLYKAKYIDRTIPDTTSPAMRLGHIFAMLLDGRQRDLHVPHYKGRAVSSRQTQTFRDAVAESGDPENVILEEELEQALLMVDAIVDPKTPSASYAKSLLMDSSGYTEYAVKGEFDPGNEYPRHLDVRCMVDKLIDIEGGGTMYVEVKSTRIAPASWQRKLPRHIAEMNYDIRMAFNVMVLGLHLGQEVRIDSCIIYINQRRPNEVAVIDMSDETHYIARPYGPMDRRLRSLCGMLMFDGETQCLDLEKVPFTKYSQPAWRKSQLSS